MSWNPETVIPWFPIAYPWNGDSDFGRKIDSLVKQHNLKWAVETGTSCANTTRALANMFDKVYTIEINKAQYDSTTPHLKQFPNVVPYLGNSGQMLGSLLANLNLKGNGMFYLDSHWYDDFPLLTELKAIAESNVTGRCLVVIDDIDIPPNIAGDKYGDQVLNLDYVRDDLFKTGAVNYEYHIPKLTQYRGKLIAKPWS